MQFRVNEKCAKTDFQAFSNFCINSNSSCIIDNGSLYVPKLIKFMTFFRYLLDDTICKHQNAINASLIDFWEQRKTNKCWSELWSFFALALQTFTEQMMKLISFFCHSTICVALVALQKIWRKNFQLSNNRLSLMFVLNWFSSMMTWIL